MTLKTRKVRETRLMRKPEKSEDPSYQKPGKLPSLIPPVLTFRVFGMTTGGSLRDDMCRIYRANAARLGGIHGGELPDASEPEKPVYQALRPSQGLYAFGSFLDHPGARRVNQSPCRENSARIEC
jgi:hypothetical protein